MNAVGQPPSPSNITTATPVVPVAKGITTTGATYLKICGTDIAKGLTVSGSTGFVTIGNPPDCAANRVTAPGVTLDGNKAGFIFAGNTVASSVTVTNNVGGPNTVKGNKIFTNLACSGNSPAPTNAGTPNTTTTGTKTGQCTAL